MQTFFGVDIRFPDTKTGKQIRTIGKSAASLIRPECRKKKSTYVFPADVGEGHSIGAAHVMGRVSKKAGFTDVTLHTLRHTFASVGADLGFTELTLAGLLGHAARGMTQRYVHLDEALIVAADRISERIDLLLNEGVKVAERAMRVTKNPVLARLAAA